MEKASQEKEGDRWGRYHVDETGDDRDLVRSASAMRVFVAWLRSTPQRLSGTLRALQQRECQDDLLLSGTDVGGSVGGEVLALRHQGYGPPKCNYGPADLLRSRSRSLPAGATIGKSGSFTGDV